MDKLTMNTELQPTPSKTVRLRSPSYPSISLGKAIELANKIYSHEKRNSVPAKVIAQHWNYKASSSGFKLSISALKKYGLLKGRITVALTDLTFDIILRGEQSPERKEAMKTAALNPKIHANLWKKYAETGLASDEALKEHLLADLKFNDNYVELFIKNFKGTILLANLSMNDKLIDNNDENKNNLDDNEAQIAIGSYVQWISQGVDQFSSPKCINGISDDGEWAYVEDNETGIHMSELEVIDSPELKKKPPLNPLYKPSNSDTLKDNYAKERITLDEGPVIIQWPSELGKNSVEDLDYWLTGLMTRAKRKAGICLEDTK